MKRIKEAFRIGYTTQRKDLPAWLYHRVDRMKGSGFTLFNHSNQYEWGDYVVLTEDDSFVVMTREEVESIIHNAEVFKEKLSGT